MVLFNFITLLFMDLTNFLIDVLESQGNHSLAWRQFLEGCFYLLQQLHVGGLSNII